MRSASGSVARTRSAWCSRADAARPGPSTRGTSGFGVLVTLGNWPSGRHLLRRPGSAGSPAACSTSIAVIDADAVQRREDDLEARPPSAAGPGSACGTGRCTPCAARHRGSGPCRPRTASAQGSVLIVVHLIDEVGHDLVVGRHRLAAALVVELAAVVVGRVVRGGDVQPAVGLQVADGERQLRRGQVARAVRRQDVRRGCRWRRRRRRRTGRSPGSTGAGPGWAGRGCRPARLSSNWRTS